MKGYLSPLAKFKLLHLADYLANKWGAAVRSAFLENLNRKVEQISAFPESCPRVESFDSIRRCLVVSHCSLYYRVQQDEIEIITIIDTRQDPEQIRQEISKHFSK